MRRIVQHLHSIALILFVALGLSSCRDDMMRGYFPEDEDYDISSSDDEEGVYEIALDIPELMETSTRSLSTSQESDAYDVQVLVFNVPDGVQNDSETYAYLARIIQKPYFKTDHYVMRIKLNSATDKQRLVLLANVPGGKLPTTIQPGQTKRQVYEKLVFNYSATGWKSDGEKSGATKGTDYDLLPMWGESKAIPVGENSRVDFEDYHYTDKIIRLYRALARVDVGIAFDDPASASATLPETNKRENADERLFDFKEIYVYRPAQQYRLAGDITTISNANGGAYRPTVPVLPTSVQYYTTKKADQLQKHSVNPDDARSVRTIYLPESPATTADNVRDQLNESTCIVIGGIYKGDNYNPKGRENTAMSYYRVDFVKTEQAQGEVKTTYLPILRNHRYRLNVVRVDGPGHKTPEDAINNTSKDVLYNVSIWDENDISQVVTDGRYFLRLSRDVIKVGKLGGDIPIKFETNWDKGWELVIPEKLKNGQPNPLYSKEYDAYKEKDWVKWVNKDDRSQVGDIRFKASTPGMETKEEEVIFRVNPIPSSTTYPKRYGEFIVQTKGGRLNWVIQVHQNPTLDVDLVLYEDRKMTTQINFLQIHEEGYNWDRTIKVGEKEYTPVDQGAYKTFYVHALPYGRDYVPQIMSDGGHEFMFWDYKSYPNGPEKTSKPFPKGAFKKLSEFTDKKDLFKYLDSDNLWEVTASNAKMSNETNPFELCRNKYYFSLEVHDPFNNNVIEKSSKSVNFLQEEYNVRFYKDKACTQLFAPREMYFLMDGSEHTVYVKSNLSYKVWIENFKPEADVEVARHGRKVFDDETVVVEGKTVRMYNEKFFPIWKGPGVRGKWNRDGGQDPSSYMYRESAAFSSSGNLSGDEVVLHLRDDFSDPAVILAYSEWKLKIENPLYAYKLEGVIGETYDGKKIEEPKDQKIPRDTRYLGLMAAIPQPEANSYILGLGQGGILIPISRVNTAADFYNNRVEMPESWSEKWKTDIITGVKRAYPMSDEASWSTWFNQQKLQKIEKGDNLSVDLLWTDCLMGKKDPDGRYRPIGPNKPIMKLEFLKFNGTQYILVIPGPPLNEQKIDVPAEDYNEGNVVIVLRGMDDKFKRATLKNGDGAGTQLEQEYLKMFPDGKPILWSWHLILRNPTKYRNSKGHIAYKLPMKVTLQPRAFKPGSTYDANIPRDFLDRALGAIDKPSELSNNGLMWVGFNRRQLPVQYQFGRKDPFPQHVSEGNFFHDRNGDNFDFFYLSGVTISMRQSIENPSLFIASYYYKTWLTEGVFDKDDLTTDTDGLLWQITEIWGSRPRYGGLNDSNLRWRYTAATNKTPLDPSPYGWKIPSVGKEFGFYFPQGSFGSDEIALNNYRALKINSSAYICKTLGASYWLPIDMRTLNKVYKTSNATSYLVNGAGATYKRPDASSQVHTATAFTNRNASGVVNWTPEGVFNPGYHDQGFKCTPFQVRAVECETERDYATYFNWDPSLYKYNIRERAARSRR